MFWTTSMLTDEEASVGCAGVAGCGWGTLLTRKFVSSLTSQQGTSIHKPPYRLDDDFGLCHFLSPRAPPPILLLADSCIRTAINLYASTIHPLHSHVSRLLLLLHYALRIPSGVTQQLATVIRGRGTQPPRLPGLAYSTRRTRTCWVTKDTRTLFRTAFFRHGTGSGKHDRPLYPRWQQRRNWRNAMCIQSAKDNDFHFY